MATKRENYAEIRDILVEKGRTDLVDFVDGEVALVIKKNSYKSTKPTKTQIANVALKGEILGVLSATPMSVEDIKATNPDWSGMSVQKMSAQLGDLVDEGKANRTYIKRKAYFTLA
jgi:hypothetical protein